MKHLLKLLLVIVMAQIVVSCNDVEPCPCMLEMRWPSCNLSIHEPLPAEAGSMDVEISCIKEAVDYEGVPVNLMASSLALLQKPQEEWPQYENTELMFFPELVYKEAGYDSYPNDINFTYTYKWLTVATCKDAGAIYGLMRLSWEANDSPTARRIFISIGLPEKLEFELIQSGVESDK